MAAGERLALEGYFTSLFEEENSDESDDEYVPRDLLWRKVRLNLLLIRAVISRRGGGGGGCLYSLYYITVQSTMYVY